MKRLSVQSSTLAAIASILAGLGALAVNLALGKNGAPGWVTIGIAALSGAVIVSLVIARTESRADVDPNIAYRTILSSAYVYYGTLVSRLSPLIDLRLRIMSDHLSGSSPQTGLRLESGEIISSRDFFDWYSNHPQRVLIVGPPGSGKTSLLIQLGAEIARSSGESSRYIPLLVRLSDLAFRDPSFISRYLSDALARLYNVPSRLSERLLDLHYILPLFDGLDEIPAERRQETLYRIIEWVTSRPGQPAVLTCRTSEYSQIERQVPVDLVVSIEPLSPSEIRDYLSRFWQPGETDDLNSRALVNALESSGVATVPLVLRLLASLPREKFSLDRSLAASEQLMSDIEKGLLAVSKDLSDVSFTSLEVPEQRLLDAMEPEVSYDIAQISSSAGLAPSECRSILEPLIARGLIKDVQDNRGRRRFVRVMAIQER